MASVVACVFVQSRVHYANSLYTGMSSVNFWQTAVGADHTCTRCYSHRETGPHPAIAQETALATDPSTCRFQGFTVDIFNSLFWWISTSEFAADYKPTRSLRSAEEHLLVVPRTTLSSTSRAFSVAGQTLWNNLPLDTRNSKTTSIFRKLLKIYLYKQAYEH